VSKVLDLIRRMIENILLFSEHGSEITLRKYQEGVAVAVVDSVIHGKGLSFVVMFPRQSGKNELQAQIEAYLLLLYSQIGGEIVKVSPTWKPQSLNAMRRLERTLTKNLITRPRWVKERDYIYKMGEARIFFLSGRPEANVVGATASTLLEVDEAQDVQTAKYDKEINPMAASTNATRIFWGTAWTSTTLLARELRAALAAEARDGIRRAFVMTATEVSAEVAAYGKFVEEQVSKMGRNHPMIRTQFFSEEIDTDAGMFPSARIALMYGMHSFIPIPAPGYIYAFLIDVAGEDENKNRDGGDIGDAELAHPERDKTILTIVEIDLNTISDEMLKAPTYRVVNRQSWIGDSQVFLYGVIRALADTWKPRYLVIDATGIGAGLASFLEKSLPGRVLPYVFNSSTKSKLGWDFISVIETGRFRDGAGGDPQQIYLHNTFLNQLSHCQIEVVEGPDKKIKWGVPAGMRDAATGEILHDDLILSAALCAVLDGQVWTIGGGTVVIQAKDVLEDLDNGRF
jgi:hypothetical protein